MVPLFFHLKKKNYTAQIPFIWNLSSSSVGINKWVKAESWEGKLRVLDAKDLLLSQVVRVASLCRIWGERQPWQQSPVSSDSMVIGFAEAVPYPHNLSPQVICTFLVCTWTLCWNLHCAFGLNSFTWIVLSIYIHRPALYVKFLPNHRGIF